jgi:hypothetical protein
VRAVAAVVLLVAPGASVVHLRSFDTRMPQASRAQVALG